MLGPLTYLDAALIAMMIISGFLAMYRGLTRELLSLVSWAVAAAAAFYVITAHENVVQQAARDFGMPDLLAKVFVGAIVFLVVLIVVHFMTIKLSDRILDSNIGMIDQMLGLVFGVLRGLLLIVIPYLGWLQLADTTTNPDWIAKSKSLPYIESTGETVMWVITQFAPQIEERLKPSNDEQS